LIPIALKLALTILGAALFAGSFFIRTSVDRGLMITRDKGPDLQRDASAFGLRAIGAVLMIAGLLTWVVGYSIANRSAGLF
jgi:hypothetical protein